MPPKNFNRKLKYQLSNDKKVRIIFPRERKWQYAQGDKIVVSTYGIPEEFRLSFHKILTATSAYYRQIFGSQSIGWLEMNVRKQSQMSHRLWTNGSDRIYLTLSKKKQLEPPDVSRVFNMHGLTHELGHIILYRSLINIHQLPEGWGEGWAVYVASFMAIPHLFAKFGPNIWPYPYDYLRIEGPEKYLNRFKLLQTKKENPILKVVYNLHSLCQRLGTKRFQNLFRQLLKKPIRADVFCSKVEQEAERAAN